MALGSPCSYRGADVRMSAVANTASKAVVNLASRTRIRNPKQAGVAAELQRDAVLDHEDVEPAEEDGVGP